MSAPKDSLCQVAVLILGLTLSSAFYAIDLSAQTPAVNSNLQPTPNSAPTSNKTLALPALSMPWRLVGIDASQSAPAHAALLQSAHALAQSWLTQPQALTAYAAPYKAITLNAQRQTDSIWTGSLSRQNPTSATLTVEPIWCSIMDQQLLIVAIADAERDILLAAEHLLIDRPTWDTMLRGKNPAPWLQAQIVKLLDNAWQKLSAYTPALNNDGLHIGFSLGYNVSRRDEGDSQCLNMLVSEKLAATYTIVRPLGADRLATARFVLGLEPMLVRPTRVVLTRWLTTAKSPQERHLPVTFNLKATLIESVFGKRIPTDHDSRWTFATGSSGQVDFNIDAKLTSFFQSERESLLLTDGPQVAKVYGAWVYLDRGRAFGLKMRDRLIANVAGDQIEGHVVRFFGPEELLTSPRGYPIREGAILYIRKNQHLPKPGITFKFDPTTYPR